ncbi:MAG: helix-turn-helix domain-containing protein [Spirochaetia bacterium]
MFNSKGAYYKRLIYSYISLFVFPLIIIVLLSHLYITPTIYKKEVDYSNRLLNHIANSTEMVFNEINQIAFNYSIDSDFQKVLSSEPIHDTYFIREVTNRIARIQHANENLHSVYLYSTYNNKVIHSEGFYRHLDNFYDREFLEQYIDTNKKTLVESRFINIENNIGKITGKTKVISIVKYLRGRHGIFVFNIRESTVRNIIESLSGNNGTVLIIGKHGNIISHSHDDNTANSLISAEFLDSITTSNKNNFTISGNGNTLSNEKMVSFVKSNLQNWIFVNIVDTGNLRAASIKITAIVFSASLLCMILGLLSAFLFSRKIYTPVELLMSNIKKIISRNEESVGKSYIDTVDEFKYINFVIDRWADEEKSMKEKLSSSNALAAERFLQKLLTGEIPENEIQKKPDFLNLELKDGFFIVITVELDNWERLTYHMSEKEINRAKEHIRDIIREKFAECGYNITSANFEQKRLSAVISYTKEQKIEAVSNVLNVANCVKRTIREQLGSSVSIGIGEPISSRHEIFKSYYQSCNALDYKILYGSSQILYISDLRRGKSKNYIDLYRIEFDNELILKAVVNMDCNKIVRQFEKTVDKLINIGADTSYIRILFLQYIGSISRISYELNIDSAKDIGNSEYENAIKCRTVTDMKSYIYSYTQKIIQAYEEGKENDITNEIVEKVKNHIISNYDEAICLDSMADMVYVSKYHLSRIFKQKVGKKFNEFLNSTRIEKAKEFLETTNLDIKDIAGKVGYDTPNSFSRMFKNRTGLSPTAYRNRLKRTHLQAEEIHLWSNKRVPEQ